MDSTGSAGDELNLLVMFKDPARRQRPATSKRTRWPATSKRTRRLYCTAAMQRYLKHTKNKAERAPRAQNQMIYPGLTPTTTDSKRPWRRRDLKHRKTNSRRSALAYAWRCGWKSSSSTEEPSRSRSPESASVRRRRPGSVAGVATPRAASTVC
ncbi:unnamed protein product [Urochloa humidicola]